MLQERSDSTYKSLPKREYELHRPQMASPRMELGQGEQETMPKCHGDHVKGGLAVDVCPLGNRLMIFLLILENHQKILT